jgi:type II secretory pathway component PulJ
MDATTREPNIRDGHSMMEMLVVVTVLAGIATVAWPMLRTPVSKLQLQSAAQEVTSELAKARMKAMQSGVSQVFRVQLHTGKFQVATVDATDDEQPPASADAVAKAHAQSATSPESDSTDDEDDWEVVERELPKGISFEMPDEPTEEAPKQEVVETADGWVDIAIFFPDGASTNATVGLHGDSDYCVDVKLNCLTGAAKIGETHRQELR